ncbi:hypothetical protein [Streptomyces sp. NPDC088812]|uniref:hypothetical protein n=1 Tax=Streptomyces sp. NPDC088812 TaxID=3365905 RepID=UPI0037FC8D30
MPDRACRDAAAAAASLAVPSLIGLLHPGLPQGRAGALLPQPMHLVARQMPRLSPEQAADVVVDTFLNGLGTP